MHSATASDAVVGDPGRTEILRIACMGTRGIPARYGGFETFYEKLSPRLAERGHEVTVYNRSWSTGQRRSFGDVRLVPLPSIRTKHLDTISHTGLSILHGLTQHFDVVLICGPGNAPLAWIPRVVGASVVLNVDGADSRRDKWGRFATAYLRAAEAGAARAATAVVADNRAVQARLRDEFGVDAVFIPYGADVRETNSVAALGRFGLVPRRYVLWVGRLEPETRVEELIEAFESLGDPGLHLVIVGDAPFAAEYKTRLLGLAGPDVVFTGYAYGIDYAELSAHAFAYVQTSPTSGTSPALLEQMGFGNAVVVRGTPTNREVVGEAGLTYDPDEPVAGLARALRRLIDDPGLVDRLRVAAVTRVREAYAWDRVADEYETLFHRLTEGQGRNNGVRTTP